MPVITRSNAAAASAARVKQREAPVTPQRPKRILECPDAPSRPFKMDFSRMNPRPVSDSFVFPKSTEQKLEEALAEIAALKKTKLSIENEFREYMNERTGHIAELLTESRELKREVKKLTDEKKMLEVEVNTVEKEMSCDYEEQVDTLKKVDTLEKENAKLTAEKTRLHADLLLVSREGRKEADARIKEIGELNVEKTRLSAGILLLSRESRKEADARIKEIDELKAENAMLKMKQTEMEDEKEEERWRVTEQIKRSSGFRPNYMKGWIQPSNHKEEKEEEKEKEQEDEEEEEESN
jgi:hypothetical protein